MSLHVTFQLPLEVEARLRRELSDLDNTVREAFVLEMFRSGRISHQELSVILNQDRFQTDAWLKRHGVFEGSLTGADLDDDRRTLDRVLGKVG